MPRIFPALGRLSGTLFVLLAVALLAVAPASAQPAASAGGSGASTTDASTEALRDLIVTLESETGRTELIDQLKALLEARRNAGGGAGGVAESDAGLAAIDGGAMFDAVTGRIRRVGEGLVESAQVIARAPLLVPWARDQFGDPAKRMRWVDAVFKIVLVLAVAIAVQLATGWLLRRPRSALEARASDAWAARALTLIARMLLELVPVAAFALAAELTLALLASREAVVAAARALVVANVLVRGLLVVARTIVAPHVARLRLLPLGDESANYAYIWVRRFAHVGLYTGFTIEAAALLGLPAAGRIVFDQLLALVLVGMTVALILQMRESVRGWIAGDAGRTGAGLRARLADIWHVVAIIYVVMLFCVWLLDVAGGFALIARATAGTLLAIVLAWLVDLGLHRLLNSLFSLQRETREQYPGLEARAARYLPVVHGVVRAAVWFVALIAVAEAWGVNAVGWLTSDTGRAVVGALAQILVVAVLSVTLLELASSAIERYMRRSRDNGTISSRMLTLLPLLRNVLRVTIAVIATLIVLSEIGIDIGPLLAGAGVAGLAIGFGSQKLVQDVINGMFIIIEDTIAVGDVVSVGGQTGLCEGITIRTITLRDLSGTVHTVPFSDVTTIQNLTKDFSFAVMDVGVAYREDTDAVIEILQTVAEELRAEEQYGAVMLEPLEVLGVDEFADSAVVIKVRIKTLPIKQWMVKREFNRRMKKAFDANNIEIPFPHTTLYFGEGKQGESPPAHIVLEENLAELAGDGGDGSATDEEAAADPAVDRPGTDLPE